MNLELLTHEFGEVPCRLDCELVVLPDPHSGTTDVARPSWVANTPTSPTAAAFNRRGSYLAAGYWDGRVLLWDFYTRHGTDGMGKDAVPALAMPAHAAKVTAVQWNRRSDRLLTGSFDGKLKLWHLPRLAAALAPCAPLADGKLDGASSACVEEVAFDAPVMDACLQNRVAQPAHRALGAPMPRCHLAVAVLASGECWLVELEPDCIRRQLVTWGDAPLPPPSPPSPSSSSAAIAPTVRTTAVAFDRRGQWLFGGTSTGEVWMVQSPWSLNGDNFQCKGEGPGAVPSRLVRVPGRCAIKQLRFSKDGRWLLVNSDKVLRMYRMQHDPTTAARGCGELLRPRAEGRPRELMDRVDGKAWRACGFATASEHVYGATEEPHQYLLYLWSMDGRLVKRMEAGNHQLRGLLALTWHPVRTFAAACTSEGPLQVWGTEIDWAAFAPEFEEIEENEVYEEREDEFDIVVPTTTADSKATANTSSLPPSAASGEVAESEEVDIVGVMRLAAFESDESGEEDDAVGFAVPVRAGQGRAHKRPRLAVVDAADSAPPPPPPAGRGRGRGKGASGEGGAAAGTTPG